MPRADNLTIFVYRSSRNLETQPPGTLRACPDLHRDCFKSLAFYQFVGRNCYSHLKTVERKQKVLPTHWSPFPKYRTSHYKGPCSEYLLSLAL